MKRSLVYVLLLALVLTGIGIYGAGKADAGSYVRYFIPYLHTNTNNVVYCVVSNQGGLFDNVTGMTFKVPSNAAGTTTGTVDLTQSTANRNLDYRKTSQFTFSGQGVYVGTSTSTAWDLSSVTDTSAAYSGELTFVSTMTGSTGSTTGAQVSSLLNCKKIGMACFQGTTTPKRNLVGYSCEAGTYDGTTYRVYKAISITSAGSVVNDGAYGRANIGGSGGLTWVPANMDTTGAGTVSGNDNATDLTY